MTNLSRAWTSLLSLPDSYPLTCWALLLLAIILAAVWGGTLGDLLAAGARAVGWAL